MISSALRGLAASFLATAPQTAALRATAAIPSLLSQSFFCTTTTEAPASQAPKAQTPKENAGADPTKQKIYCGNLAWAVRSNDLEQLFSKYGKVHDAGKRSVRIYALALHGHSILSHAWNGCFLCDKVHGVLRLLAFVITTAVVLMDSRSQMSRVSCPECCSDCRGQSHGLVSPCAHGVASHACVPCVDVQGFGFVTLDKEAAKQAISEVNATDFQGRAIKVRQYIGCGLQHTTSGVTEQG